MRTPLHLTILVAAALLLASCGGGDAGDSTASAGGPGPIDVGGSEPVDTAIAIDATSVLRGDRTLARQYKQAALAAAEPTITRGGTIAVKLFARVDGRALPIYNATSPSLAEKDRALRAGDDEARRQQLGATLDAVLGLRKAPPAVRRQIDRVTSGPGSDIARAVGSAIEDAGRGAVAVVLTDGLLDDGNLVARRMFDGTATRAALAKRVARQAGVRKGTPKIELLRISGIGATSGRNDLPSDKAEQLVKLWNAACKRLPVRRCEPQQELTH